MAQTMQVPLGCDMHVHLRQGNLMQMVTPLISGGGVGTVFVMPNLQPPIKTTDDALQYKYIMSLYLSPELTPEEIRKAAKAGIVGVKSYPRGVTTNSDSGIESYEAYYPVFEAMQEVGMVLNLHGEIPSDHDNGICVLNAEEKFLVHLTKLHTRFPKLRMVLEHATTQAAVERVKELGDTVACTITAHHLELVVDDWAGFAHHFCKPVAKYPHDRQALRDVIKQGHPRFFLGSDSAPHPKDRKEAMGNLPCAAGVFTTPYLLPYIATLFESLGCLDRLADFTSNNGAKFYQLDNSSGGFVTLMRQEHDIPDEIHYVDENSSGRSVVPYKAGKSLTWKIIS
ncbi:dihydroorotase, variant 2 [Entomophthora muscae]|uniref:Dihydroorotase, variant 2 n=2 Tax=Entomophthora muscae TaxID=34485 RepID=A0ACC2UP65_9FUNG|nr:dihydroorotase, variant 2 [Entomophthora muscae]